MDRRRWLAFVGRVGREEAAGRLRVSAKTLATWISRGVPAAHERRVEETLQRHERSRKAAETRIARQRWREEFEVPPEQVKGERLTPEQRTPDSPPELDRGVKRRSSRKRDEYGRWSQELWARYEIDVSPWQVVEQLYETFRANIETWGEVVARLFRAAPRRGSRVWVRLYLEKFYPLNPKYQGKPDLMKKAGKWVPITPITKGPVATDHEAAQLLIWAVESARQGFTPTGTAIQGYGLSIDDQASTRTFYVKGFVVFVGRPTPPPDVQLEREAGQGPRRGVATRRLKPAPLVRMPARPPAVRGPKRRVYTPSGKLSTLHMKLGSGDLKPTKRRATRKR
jgi:hypothetical protein